MSTNTAKKSGTITLAFVWRLRLSLKAEGSKLKAEGSKLWDEGSKLYAEGSKLYAEGDKLWAEGSTLWAEGSKLKAEGDKLWAEGVIEAYGNVPIEWHSSESCTVEGVAYTKEAP